MKRARTPVSGSGSSSALHSPPARRPPLVASPSPNKSHQAIELKTIRACKQQHQQQQPAGSGATSSTPSSSCLVSFLGVVSSPVDQRTVTRRSDGVDVDLATVYVDDASGCSMEVSLWAHQAKVAAATFQVGTVLLCHAVELQRFRDTTKASCRASSQVKVINQPSTAAKGWPRSAGDTGGMGTEEAAAALAAASSKSPSTKRARFDAHDSPSAFRSAAAVAASAVAAASSNPSDPASEADLLLPWQHDSLARRTTNWAAILAEAKALQLKTQANGYAAALYSAAGGGVHPPSSTATARGLHGASSSSLSSSSSPLVHLSDLQVGSVVSVMARLCSCQVVHLSLGNPYASSSAPADLADAAAAVAAADSKQMVVGLLSQDAASSSSWAGALEADHGGAAPSETIVEVELRQARWLTSEWKEKLARAIGGEVRLDRVKVQWRAKSDCVLLVDTADTRIVLPQELASGLPRHGEEARTHRAASGRRAMPAETRVRARLVGFEFPRLTPVCQVDLTRHLRAHAFPAGKPPPLELPPHLHPTAADSHRLHLFRCLFASTCTGCRVELEPDSHGVYECRACSTALERPSQLAAHPNEGRPGVQWTYREMSARVRTNTAERIDRDESTSSSLLLLDSDSVASLFAHIDPTCLLHSTATDGAAHAFLASPPTCTPSSTQASTGGGGGPAVGLACTPVSFSFLAQRYQFYRLLLAMLHPPEGPMGECEYTCDNQGPPAGSPSLLPVNRFTLWPSS